jgi:peptide/nickel transport system substrate-binding protein/oligopeptide transport system substrate-binding protein
VIASLAGCSKHPLEGDILYLVLETSPNKLDPAMVIDVAEGQVCSMIYQTLVRFSPGGVIIPDAAKSWKISEDGTRYIFCLDARARFSNGKPVAASDVTTSFERVLAPSSGSPRKWVLERIKGAADYANDETATIAGLSSPNDSTVVIELEKSFKPFLQLLAMPAAAIVPAAAATQTEISGETGAAAGGSVDRLPIGSGRWVLARWARGDFLELVPNPYHPAGPPQIAAVRFRIIPEAFTRIAEFEAGTLDVLKIPHAEVDRFLRTESLRDRIQSQSELRVTYVGLNNTRAPLDDVRVRQALNMAVDVERIVDVLSSGHAARAAGAVPPSLPGYAERPPYGYDPVAARDLLREAGYPDGFDLEIWQRDSPEGNRVVEAIQGYLMELGVRVRVVKREWSAFKEAVSQGRVDAFFLDWYADYPDAENFLYPLFHSENAGGGGNRAFFNDARIDSLIETAQRTLEPSRCHALYAAIDQQVHDQAPWIYLYFPTSFVVVSSRVQGYTFPVLYLGEDYSQVSITRDSNR